MKFQIILVFKVFAALISSSESKPSFEDHHFCVPPAPPPDGKVSLGRGDVVVRYSCNPGFKLIGTPVAVCIAGKWSSPKPECRPRDKSHVLKTNNKSLSSSNDMEQKDQQIVSVFEGYDLKGEEEKEEEEEGERKEVQKTRVKGRRRTGRRKKGRKRERNKNKEMNVTKKEMSKPGKNEIKILEENQEEISVSRIEKKRKKGSRRRRKSKKRKGKRGKKRRKRQRKSRRRNSNGIEKNGKTEKIEIKILESRQFDHNLSNFTKNKENKQIEMKKNGNKENENKDIEVKRNGNGNKEREKKDKKERRVGRKRKRKKGRFLRSKMKTSQNNRIEDNSILFPFENKKNIREKSSKKKTRTSTTTTTTTTTSTMTTTSPTTTPLKNIQDQNVQNSSHLKSNNNNNTTNNNKSDTIKEEIGTLLTTRLLSHSSSATDLSSRNRQSSISDDARDQKTTSTPTTRRTSTLVPASFEKSRDLLHDIITRMKNRGKIASNIFDAILAKDNKEYRRHDDNKDDKIEQRKSGKKKTDADFETKEKSKQIDSNFLENNLNLESDYDNNISGYDDDYEPLPDSYPDSYPDIYKLDYFEKENENGSSKKSKTGEADYYDHEDVKKDKNVLEVGGGSPPQGYPSPEKRLYDEDEVKAAKERFVEEEDIDFATLDTSCIISEIDSIYLPPPRVEHSHVTSYTTVTNPTRPNNVYVEAVYECDFGYQLKEATSNRLFCKKNKWVGKLAECSAYGRPRTIWSRRINR